MNTWKPWNRRLRAGLSVALALLAATVLLPAVPAAAAAPRPVITAPTPERGARFGSTVAADGDLMVIGSRHADEQGIDSGAAYVFARNQGGADRWELVKTLRPETGASGEQFGAAVAISRDVIIVGAPGNSEIGATSGAAYVFERHHGGPNNWGQTKQLFGSRADPQDSFGLAVAVSHDAIAVGAPFDDSLGQNSGLVYLFTRYAGADNRWAEVQVIEPLPDDRTDSLDAFGSSLAMDGQLLVVGVPYGDYLNQPARGAVYFYERHAGLANRWQRIRVRISGDGSREERFGSAVAIAGGRVLVGAPNHTMNGTTRGAAFVFEQNAGGANMWQQTQKLAANGGAAGDSFGHAVAIDGRRMVVGAPHHDDGNRSGVGAIYLFADSQELSRLRASDRAAGDGFGAAVALSGGLIIAGAPERHSAGLSDSGAAYLFSSASDAWNEASAIFRSAGNFGLSLALDGDTMAAHQHADSLTNRRASVTLFQRGHTGGWRQMITLVSSPNSQISRVAALDGDTLVLQTSNDLVVRERNQGGPDRWGSIHTINTGGGSFYDLDGDTLVVAQNSGLGERNENGSVRVFERNLGGINRWGLAATLTFGDTRLPQPERGDGFGSAIALDGNTLVVAAHGSFERNDDNHIFMYERNADGRSWRFARELSAGATPDNFGLSIDMDADTIAIGSVPIEDTRLGGSSEVRLYGRHVGGANRWGEIKRLPAPAQNDLFGLHVALDNDRLLVAAPFANVRGERSGAGYLYERNTGGADNWGHVQTLTGSSNVSGNFLGEEAQLDGEVAVLSSYEAGDIYIFENAVRVPPGLELELATNTADPGREVTLRARLDAAATDADLAPPQGEVYFVVNGEPVGSAPLDADGTATLTLPGMPTGIHILTATFSGGAIWGDCEAPPISLFVGVEPPAAAPEGSELFLPVVQR